MMQWHGVGLSHVGRVRQQNQDAYHTDDELGLYVVADGMGGHAAGEVASRQAIESVKRRFASDAAAVDSDEDEQALVRQAILDACHDVYTLARSDIHKAGMGTTLSMAWVRGGYAIIGHVGDSRGYLYRNDFVSQITRDHTVGAELRRAGLLDPDADIASRYVNSLSRSVGTQAVVDVDVFAVELAPGDALLLCSDGLSNYVESTEWLASQIDPAALEGTAEELIEHANDQGGRDNITAVLVGIDAGVADAAGVERRQTELNAGLRALGSVFLFEKLKMGLLSRLLSHATVHRLQPGEELIAQGSELRTLVVVVSGSLVVEQAGKELARLKVGEFAGVTSLLQPRPARAGVRAGEPSRVLTLTRTAFFRLVRSRPLLGINMLERMAAELSRELDTSIGRRDDGDPRTTSLQAVERL